MSTIVVKWGKERLHVPLPNDLSTPLRDLRAQLSQMTGLPPTSFKLIHSGAIMKDDNAPLSAFHIKSNSVIALIGSADAPPTNTNPSRKPTGPPTQQGTLSTIESELKKVRSTLQPSVETFLASIPSSSTPPPSTSTPTSPDSVSKESHNRLGELLLQSLLRLDAIIPETEWADVRSARKGAVKEVQGLLDRLDEGWKTANSSPPS